MNIYRNDNSIIKKEKIKLTNLEEYNEEKVKKATEYLNEEIENSFVNHFNNISYALKKKEKGMSFADCNPNSGCTSEHKKLHKRLEEIGLKTYFVSCEAGGFSNSAGDELVKEAHIFLVYPALKNKKVYYTIFDSSLRINHPISFYDRKDSPNTPYLEKGIAKVKYRKDNAKYPYELNLNKRLNYKHEIINADIKWGFNPYYETLNIDEYSEYIYRAMFSLKLMNYPKDLDKYLCIRSKILEGKIEIYTIEKVEEYTVNQLMTLNKQQLRKIFEEFFIKANIDTLELDNFIENLYLLIRNNQYIEKR